MDNELKQQKKQKRQTENKYATLINQNLSYVLIFYRICGKAFRICSLLATLLEVTRIFYIL